MQNVDEKPTRQDLLAAKDRSVPDIVAPNLKVLFCGINPGLYTAAVQKHFGHPGNKFWKTLYRSGFTPKLFAPGEQYELLKLGIGITNSVNRATVSQKEVAKPEFIKGGIILTKKLKKYKPEWVAFVGITAYRSAFNSPKANVGSQSKKIANAKVWLLPSTSGLNAFYSPDKVTLLFKEFKNVAIAKTRKNL